MLTRFALFLSLTTLLLFHTGCTLTESLSASTTTTKCEVTVSGGVESPGPRPLNSGDTVASVLAEVHVQTLGEPMTVVLVRHGPEGRTRRLIQLDANGKVVDPKQNVALLDGDEIVFPGSGAANPPARAVQSNNNQ